MVSAHPVTVRKHSVDVTTPYYTKYGVVSETYNNTYSCQKKPYSYGLRSHDVKIQARNVMTRQYRTAIQREPGFNVYMDINANRKRRNNNKLGLDSVYGLSRHQLCIHDTSTPYDTIRRISYRICG